MTDQSTRITAVFKGKDGSLGYIKGATYDLLVHSTKRYPIVIRRSRGGGYCPYSSQDAFDRNWVVVSDD